MTKFEALIKCRNHWQWLAITGEKYKHKYGPSRQWLASCATCDFTRKHGRLLSATCVQCPLTGYAWNFIQGRNASCLTDNSSLYVRWEEGEFCIDIRLKYAQKMVDACNQAINEMIVNGEELSYGL